MSNRHPRTPTREPSRNPFTAYLYGTRWEIQGPVGLLAPAKEDHSFKFPVAAVVRFGKLRSIDKTGVQNFICIGDGTVYRVAFKSQTRAGRKWIRLHVDRCRCPDLFVPGSTSKRLQVMHWIKALAPGDVPAEELAQEEPLLPGEQI